jgi:hypothetical protein
MEKEKVFYNLMKNNIDYLVSLKTLAEKKKIIKTILSNMSDYVGDAMSKRITTDNFKYALDQKTVPAINKVLKTSLSALK